MLLFAPSVDGLKAFDFGDAEQRWRESRGERALDHPRSETRCFVQLKKGTNFMSKKSLTPLKVDDDDDDDVLFIPLLRKKRKKENGR